MVERRRLCLTVQKVRGTGCDDRITPGNYVHVWFEDDEEHAFMTYHWLTMSAAAARLCRGDKVTFTAEVEPRPLKTGPRRGQIKLYDVFDIRGLKKKVKNGQPCL